MILSSSKKPSSSTYSSDATIENDEERIVLHVYDDESKEFSSLTTYHGMVSCEIFSRKTTIYWETPPDKNLYFGNMAFSHFLGSGSGNMCHFIHDPGIHSKMFIQTFCESREEFFLNSTILILRLLKQWKFNFLCLCFQLFPSVLKALKRMV